MEKPISPSSAGPGTGWKLAGRALAGFAVLLTLLALIYTDEDWRGHHAWASYKQDLIRRGVELDLRKLAPPKVPDDQNFAMTPFLAPFFDLNPRPLQPDQSPYRDTNGANRAFHFAEELLTTNSAPWHQPGMSDLNAWLLALQTEPDAAGATTRTAAAEWALQALEKERPVLEELRNASRRPGSRFNLDYGAEDPAGILLPHLGVLNKVSQVLQLRATAELTLGQTNAAGDDAVLMLFLAQSVHDEPTVVSQLVRMRILRLTQQVIAGGLDKHLWSDGQLADFENRLGEITLVKDLGTALQAERGAFGNGCFELIRKNPGILSGFIGQSGNASLAAYFEIAPGGRIDQEQISYQRYFDQMVWPGIEPEDGLIHPKTIDDNVTQSDQLLGNMLSCWWNNRILLRVLGPSFRACFQKVALGQTSVDQAAAACALERFRLANGALPETLAALVPLFIGRVPDDVVGGGPLKYRRTDDRHFVLYSVGWNEKDDGGTAGKNPAGTALDLTQGDWVWPRLPEQ